MKHLGYDAGVKVGDIILGVDDVRLSPGIGIAEVEKLLQRRPHHDITFSTKTRRVGSEHFSSPRCITAGTKYH